MKFLVFIRGEHSPLRDMLVKRVMAELNPNLNTVRAIRVSMNDYGPLRDKGEKKAAARSVKNMVRKLLSGSHQEKFIIVDNPNTNSADWNSFFGIADSLGVQVEGVGIGVRKNEQDPNLEEKNENDPNLHLFKAMMYKYTWVENEQDIDRAVQTLLGLDNNQ